MFFPATWGKKSRTSLDLHQIRCWGHTFKPITVPETATCWLLRAIKGHPAAGDRLVMVAEAPSKPTPALQWENTVFTHRSQEMTPCSLAFNSLVPFSFPNGTQDWRDVSGGRLAGFNVQWWRLQGWGWRIISLCFYEPQPSRIFWRYRFLAFNSGSGVSPIKNAQWRVVNISSLKSPHRSQKSGIVSYIRRQKLKPVSFLCLPKKNLPEA